MMQSEARTSHLRRKPPNKALHQTRRGGVAHFPRRGPVVEARLAGEGRCSTHVARRPLLFAAISTLSLHLAACAPPEAADLKTHLPPGTPASKVESLLGRPDSRYWDRTSWAFVLSEKDGCDKSKIKQQWLYTFWRYRDALVFFDSNGKVLCVHQSGELFEGTSL